MACRSETALATSAQRKKASVAAVAYLRGHVGSRVTTKSLAKLVASHHSWECGSSSFGGTRCLTVCALKVLTPGAAAGANRLEAGPARHGRGCLCGTHLRRRGMESWVLRWAWTRCLVWMSRLQLHTRMSAQAPPARRSQTCMLRSEEFRQLAALRRGHAASSPPTCGAASHGPELPLKRSDRIDSQCWPVPQAQGSLRNPGSQASAKIGLVRRSLLPAMRTASASISKNPNTLFSSSSTSGRRPCRRFAELLCTFGPLSGFFFPDPSILCKRQP